MFNKRVIGLIKLCKKVASQCLKAKQKSSKWSEHTGTYTLTQSYLEQIWPFF